MKKAASKTKIFVLDTSVLLFDHNALVNFEEHDVALPITVLEELDKFKVGNDTKNFEAREVIRFLDKLSGKKGLNRWISLGKEKGKIRVVMHTPNLTIDAEEIYKKDKNDHKIINAAISLKKLHKDKSVILVTKDINLRIKAKALGLIADNIEVSRICTWEKVDLFASDRREKEKRKDINWSIIGMTSVHG